MKTKRVVSFFLFLGWVFVLSACSSNSTPYPSPTAGEWSGENGSFTLLENGEITNFNWLLNAKELQSKCPISLNENLPVKEGLADLTFTNKNTGAVTFSIKIVFTSASTAQLSYEYDFCPSTFTIGFDESGKTRVFKGEAEFELTKP